MVISMKGIGSTIGLMERELTYIRTVPDMKDSGRMIVSTGLGGRLGLTDSLIKDNLKEELNQEKVF